MTLHNPSSIKLPPLEIKKINKLKEMEESEYISNFINSKLLLDSEFHKLYFKILKKSEEIFKLIEYIKKESEDSEEICSMTMTSENPEKMIIETFSGKKYSPDSELFSSENFYDDKKREKLLLKIKKEDLNSKRDEIEIISNQIQDLLSDFEKKKNKKLDILDHTVLFLCDNCSRLVSLNKFHRSNCKCGVKTSSSYVSNSTFYHFNKELIEFIKKNCWLEHGMDRLLRKKEFETLVGYYILGHSGNWHEIDNVAESKTEHYRFFGECKSGKRIKPNDIFTFSGKMGDIGCTRGYIFTTLPRSEMTMEVIRLARSKNIDIITDVLGKKTEDLLNEIKEN